MINEIVSNANEQIRTRLGQVAALEFELTASSGADLIDLAAERRAICTIALPVLEKLVQGNIVAEVTRSIFAVARYEFAAGARFGHTTVEQHLRSGLDVPS